MQQERPRKLQRISQACDLCHRRSIRCRPSNEETERCQNCYDFDVACTYDRPSKRRKHPQAPTAPQQSARSSQSHSTLDLVPPSNHHHTGMRNDSVGKANDFGVPGNLHPATPGNLHSGALGHLDLPWKAFALSSEAVVLELFDVYMEVVYPLYPFFHEATERRRLKNRDHLTDKGFFASIMAACALASARIRDGAQPTKIPDASQNPEASSEVFFAAAKSVFSVDLNAIRGTDYLRACALLALTSIQYGQHSDVQQHIGIASTLVAMQRFYDEKFWPNDLPDTQKETYRRLYWGIYTLEVYAAVVWNCFLRTQEVHANVHYPNDKDDGTIVSSHDEASRGPHHSSWLTGWNFTIDLYRVLEHVLNKARAKRFNHDDRRSVDSLVFGDAFSEKGVMSTMLNMYYGLPPQFKATPPMTGDASKDIYAFQAANIQATLQLLRMMLFATEDAPDVDRKCDVANEVLSVFQTIPTRYLRAISTPLVYQIGSIGHVLGSVFEGPLQQNVYERVRGSLLLMAELLETLESNLHHSAGASQALLSQVDKIDKYMSSQTMTTHAMPPPPSQQSAHPQVDMVGNHLAMPMPGAGGASGIQLPTDLALEWPWPLYSDGPFYPENGY